MCAESTCACPRRCGERAPRCERPLRVLLRAGARHHRPPRDRCGAAAAARPRCEQSCSRRPLPIFAVDAAGNSARLEPRERRALRLDRERGDRFVAAVRRSSDEINALTERAFAGENGSRTRGAVRPARTAGRSPVNISVAPLRNAKGRVVSASWLSPTSAISSGRSSRCARARCGSVHWCRTPPTW